MHRKEKEHVFHRLHVASGRTSTNNGVQSNGPGAWVTRNCSPAPKISLVVMFWQAQPQSQCHSEGWGKLGPRSCILGSGDLSGNHSGSAGLYAKKKKKGSR